VCPRCKEKALYLNLQGVCRRCEQEVLAARAGREQIRAKREREQQQGQSEQAE
jgi:hypothetical protein